VGERGYYGGSKKLKREGESVVRVEVGSSSKTRVGGAPTLQATCGGEKVYDSG